MFGRRRSTRWLLTLSATSLLALSVPAGSAPSVRAADPPQYYAIALGMVNGVTGANAMNEAGVLGALTNDGRLARITGATIEPFGASGGYPFDINESGTVVGNVGHEAVRVDGSTVTPLPGLVDGTYETARGINDAGTLVVGSSNLPGDLMHAWVHDGTTTTDLGTLGGDYSIADRVNDSGLIAGSARDATGDMHLVTWLDGVIADLGNLGGDSANAYDLNEAGQVLGYVSGFGFGNRTAFWDGSTLVDIGNLGGTSTYPSAMNEAGQIVASATNASDQTRAAFWDGGALMDLGTLPGGAQSWAGGINDQGQIAGTSEVTGGQQHGFLIDDGVMYDLNDLVPAHSIEIRDAGMISNSGHILAGSTAGPVLLVPGVRPTAAYDVIDLGDPLTGYDAYPRDMNASREATGAIDGRAFYHDGTASTFLFAPGGESVGTAINAAGSITGYTDQGGDGQAFLYDGSVQLLGTLGGPSSHGRDINDAGDVVGTSDTSGGARHAFVYRGGVMTDIQPIGDTGSEAVAINGSGKVIGYSYDGQFTGPADGFVYDGTTTTILGTLGGPLTYPYAINEAGDIVGTSSTPTQANHAFRYVDGTMSSVAPPGSTSSEGIAINEAGAIAGSYLAANGDRRAFLFEDGAFSIIPGMDGSFATATDINEQGHVVGYASTDDGVRGYLFDHGDLVDLSTQVPLGYEALVSVAFKIGDDGTILARGQTSGFNDRAILLVPTVAPDPPLTIDASAPAPASVPRLGRFEKRFSLNRSYGADEIHDPAVIDVTATFTAPGGTSYTVPAYFGTDYTLRPGTGIGGTELYDPVPGTESGVWHVRFSPDEVGEWTYRLRARDHVPGQQMTVQSPPMTFDVTASTAKGQVERDPRDDRFLRYADGTPYLPMGHNVAFGDGNPLNDGSHFYEPHFASMQAAGQNWTRVWMTDFYITALEWSATHWSNQYDGVGRYGDVPAFRIEQILDLAEEYGLEVQLVLNDHGQFSSHVNARWYDNPYNAANGGPIPDADPAAFFSDPEARQLFKQRLRYLVARYGAYRDILAWELFNETQFIGSATTNPFTSQDVRDDLVAWHAEMAAYLRSIDPYDHLITTSSDIDTSAAAIWNDPNIDLVQVHDYGSSAGRDERFHGYAEDLNATYGKPVIIGEFGLSGTRPELEFDPTTSTLPADEVAHLVQATHLHNSAWASAMSASGAMSWWWGGYIRDNAARHRLPPDFPANERVNPPLRDFFAGEDLAGMDLDETAIATSPSVIGIGMHGTTHGFAWIRDAENTYGSGVGPGDLEDRTMSGVAVGFDGFAPGTYRIEIHDPWGIEPMDDSIVAVVNTGALTFTLPDFQRDVALKIRPVGPASPAHPVTATITSPVPGSITITESPTTDPPPVGSGYTFLDAQLDITAPTASTTIPLQLMFTVDAALLASVDPDLTASTLTVFRNAVPVEPCTAITTDDPATPNPCVSLRETLTGAEAGDARITVLTSAASTWNFGSAAQTAPGAPTAVTAVKGDRQASVSWTAPSNDGGSQITGYTVTSSPGNRTATVNGSTTTAIVTGLTNGTSYTFTVRATNVIGTGPASAPSNAVTPAALLAQTITFTNPGAKTLLASPVTVAPTATSRPAGDHRLQLAGGLHGRWIPDQPRSRRHLQHHGKPARGCHVPTGDLDHAHVRRQPGDADHHVHEPGCQDHARHTRDGGAHSQQWPSRDAHVEHDGRLHGGRVRDHLARGGFVLDHGEPGGRLLLQAGQCDHPGVHRQPGGPDHHVPEPGYQDPARLPRDGGTYRQLGAVGHAHVHDDDGVHGGGLRHHPARHGHLLDPGEPGGRHGL